MSRQSLFFIAAGLVIGVVGWFDKSLSSFLVGAVVMGLGLEQLYESRIHHLSTRERAEGGEG